MEALILYFVLFFPGIYTSGLPAGEFVAFSLIRELGRTLTYTAPSLALLWYLITDKKGLKPLRELRIHKPDLITLGICLPALIIISLLVSLLAWLLSHQLGLPVPPRIESPATATGWIILVFSCLGAGYLEESYFRYYLLTRLENRLPNIILRIGLSTLLFSLCHMYEGPWGILNAVLAGVLLSVFFARYKSLHGIAWAHGAYNIFVYIMGVFVS